MSSTPINNENIPKKRGRKPKPTNIDTQINGNETSNQIILKQNDNIIFEINECQQNTSNENTDNNTNTENNQLVKKRGRKPKGGKIIQQNVYFQNTNEPKINVILHLKCFLKDLNLINSNSNIDGFSFRTNICGLKYDNLDNNSIINNTINGTLNRPSTGSNNDIENNNGMFFENEDEKHNEPRHEHPHDHDSDTDNDCEKYKEDKFKDIWKKIKIIKQNLHINNVENNRSACFWDTHKFNNPPVYIPKYYMNETYHVYGCFCSPECAVAHLMQENIDSSVKFERYQMLNNIYSKIYEYNKNIKPAPNPYYLLDKYYGNMNIQEYRSLLSSERLFLITDKPLTRIMPELHEDNNDFIINNKIIQNNVKFDKRSKMKKTNILSEHFGLIT